MPVQMRKFFLRELLLACPCKVSLLHISHAITRSSHPPWIVYLDTADYNT